jgi:hypothetical protein
MSVIFFDHFTDNVGISTVSDHVQATLHHDESGIPGVAAEENQLN